MKSITLVLALAAAAWGQGPESRTSAGRSIICTGDALELRLDRGQTIRYEVKEDSLSTQRTGAEERVRKGATIRAVELKVLEAPARGPFRVEYRTSTVRVSFKGFSASDSFELDASRPDSRPAESDPNKLLWRTFLTAGDGHPLVLTLDSRARLLSVTGAEEIRKTELTEQTGISDSIRPLIEPYFTDDHHRSALQGLFAEMPEPGGPISWVPQSGVHRCVGLGGKCETIRVTTRLSASTGDQAEFTWASLRSETRPAEHQPATTVQGKAAVSWKDGLIDLSVTNVHSVRSFESGDGPVITTTDTRITISRLKPERTTTRK